jgi:hypothetical protein
MSFASTLPIPASQPGESGDLDATTALPRMVDATGSYRDTLQEAPALPEPQAHSPAQAAQTAAFNAPVSSAETSPVAKDATPADCHGTPEPVSVLLMGGGLLGLIAARRLKK